MESQLNHKSLAVMSLNVVQQSVRTVQMSGVASANILPLRVQVLALIKVLPTQSSYAHSKVLESMTQMCTLSSLSKELEYMRFAVLRSSTSLSSQALAMVEKELTKEFKNTTLVDLRLKKSLNLKREKSTQV